MGDPEQRQFSRIPSDLLASIRISGREDDADADIAAVKDLSRGGSFLETSDVPPIGAEVEMVFRFPDGSHQYSLFGTVRWRREGEPRGIGVEFSRALEGGRTPLDRYLQERTSVKPRREELGTTTYMLQTDDAGTPQKEGTAKDEENVGTELYAPVPEEEVQHEENEKLMRLIEAGDLEAIRERGYRVKTRSLRPRKKSKKKR